MSVVPSEHLGVPNLRHRQGLLHTLKQQIGHVDLPAVHTAAAKYLDGFPTRTSGSGEPGGGVHATSTVPVRLTERGIATDPARDALTNLDRALERASRALQDALSAQAALTTVAPYQKSDGSLPPDGGCHVMWRVGVFEPMKGAGATDVAGTLKEATVMCGSVYDFVRKRGRLPSVEECEAFRDRGRWPKEYEKGKNR